jgi:hypothetical protein
VYFNELQKLGVLAPRSGGKIRDNSRDNSTVTAENMRGCEKRWKRELSTSVSLPLHLAEGERLRVSGALHRGLEG